MHPTYEHYREEINTAGGDYCAVGVSTTWHGTPPRLPGAWTSSADFEAGEYWLGEFGNADLRDVTDGLTQTMLLHERGGQPAHYGKLSQQNPVIWIGHWMGMDTHMMNRDFGINDWNYENLFSFHPGGVQAAMCDGSVHFLNEDIDIDTLVALVSREWGEVVDPTKWR